MKTILSATQIIFALSAYCAVSGAFARTLLIENSAAGQLRGAKTTSETFSRRRLPKRPGGSSHSTSHSGYLGCLGLSDSELKSSWKLSGRAPKCQYKHHAGKGNSASSGSSSTEGDGNSGADNETTNDSDHVVNNGNFENVNGDEGSGENAESANSNGNGGNTNNNGNGGNSNNNGNGGNANNNGNGGNANNNDNNGGNANNNGNGDNDDDGKNSGNSNGQNNQGQSSFDPYGDFDITKCDTYENLWLWDLSLTCAKEGDASTCECIFAEEMMELGSLSCEDALVCPRRCQICSRCMQLLGCQVPRSSTSFFGSSRNVSFLAVALGFLVCGGAYYTRRRRRRGPSILQKQLLDDNSSTSDRSSDGTRVWLAPVASTHDQEESSIFSYNNAAQLPIWVPPRRDGKDQQPVWLAPDASLRQFASTVDIEEKDETPVWLAPDATSVQLKGSFDDFQDSCLKTKELGKKSDQMEHRQVKKAVHRPDSLSKQQEKQYAEHEENKDQNPVSLADNFSLSAELDQLQIESMVSEEAEEEISLGAWSVEAEDPSIIGIPCPQSNLSAIHFQTPDTKCNAELNPMIAPDSVSEESDDDSLPTLT